MDRRSSELLGFAPDARVLIVSCDEPVGVTGFELKLALVALGRPLTLSVTGLPLPLTVIVVALLPPRGTVSGFGAAARLKSDDEPPPTVNELIAVLHR